ncbi:MAG: DUF4340 domain-containing protein [Myxococcales bacterium]|nr:DUF4340 domain-containing protein [Myxococcales bacterium]
MIRRFRGALLAIGLLGALVAAAWWLERPAPVADLESPDQLFAFEKDDLVAFTILHRPDGEELSFRRTSEGWVAEGRPWVPSDTMMRRAAHQLHDRTARADVGDARQDRERYGLGDGAVEVHLELRDGTRPAFAVGDPNPTSVSWYVRPLPDDKVYVVKKSAMDFWTAPLEDFREDRLVSFDADDVTRLVVEVDGTRQAFERVGDRVYRMTEPVDQPAEREAVRRMLGRLSALRATSFVQDGHADLQRWSLEPGLHRFEVTTESGAVHRVRFGSAVAADPPQRYAFVERADQVILVADDVLDSFRGTPEELRDRELLPDHRAHQVTAAVVTQGGERIALTGSPDGWRWEDGSPVSGATPRRVVQYAADLRAEAFVEGPGVGLDPAWATVDLTFDDGATARVFVGDPVSPEPGDDQRYVRVDEGPVARAGGALASSIADLVRERDRKEERDARKLPDRVDAP